MSPSYILGKGYVDAKQQPVKEFPIEDFAQSLTNIIQAELAKTSFGNVYKWGSHKLAFYGLPSHGYFRFRIYEFLVNMFFIVI